MAFALVQHTSAHTSTAGTTTSKAFASSPASGNLLLVMLFLNNNTPTFGSTPTGASITGSWVPLAGSGVDSLAAIAQAFQAWGAINNATGTSTISLSWTGSGTSDFVICEFSGITGPVTQDGSVASADDTTSTSVTVPSFTPGVTGDLLVQAGMSATNITAASGGTPAWTQGDVSTQLTSTGDGWGWQTGGTSATAANMTASGTSNTGVIFAVKASGAAATGIPDLIMAPPHR